MATKKKKTAPPLDTTGCKEGFIELVVTIPFYGNDEHQLKSAARIRDHLRLSVDSRVEVSLVEYTEDGGEIFTIPDITYERII